MGYIDRDRVLEIAARHLPPERFQRLLRLPELKEKTTEWAPVTYGDPEQQMGVECTNCGAEFYTDRVDIMYITNYDINYCPCCGARVVKE